MNVRERYSKFRSRYIVQQRRQHEYAINKYYAHLIDPFFTKIAYDLKLTPNTVTILSGMMGIGAAVSFYYHYFVVGAILLQIHHLLDGVDGNLARLMNRCTSFGAKLDKISDQVVRLVLFCSLSVSLDIALWAKWALPITIFVDLFVVHCFILPHARKYHLHRAKWKKWFLDRGIIPGLDIFTIFFIISCSALLGVLGNCIYFIIIVKNIDWMYRLYECRQPAIPKLNA